MRRFLPELGYTDTEGIAALIAQHAQKLVNNNDLDELMARIGDARFVLLGEASHGTHEYYLWRMWITQRLIREKGFSFVAVEGDWPDCYRVNRFVKGYTGNDETIQQVLQNFTRWPTWMWANWETAAFAQWMHQYNTYLNHTQKVGFYGLDMYSLFESLESITGYLEKNDPAALETAHKAMRCFEPYADEGQTYARTTALVPGLCENEVTELLSKIRNHVSRYDSDHEHAFSTEQNALVAVNAEKYYRAMLKGGSYSWNIRDHHMVDTLERLMEFHGPHAKAVIWEHNTHIGDARATDMEQENMVNTGQLIREKYGKEDAVLVGFGSYAGTVIAGEYWGGPMNEMEMPEAVKGSWEHLFHNATGGNKIIFSQPLMESILTEQPIGHRAIGVIYNPSLERFGNYVPSIMPMRYDAFIFLDQTTALHPMHIKPHGHEVPDTYPFGV